MLRGATVYIVCSCMGTKYMIPARATMWSEAKRQADEDAREHRQIEDWKIYTKYMDACYSFPRGYTRHALQTNKGILTGP